jgi:hypothetical protein
MFRHSNIISWLDLRQRLLQSLAAMIAVVICAAASLADGPCRTLIPEKLRTPNVIKQAEQVSRILDELSKSRDKFLQTGDLIELFPELYYHATRAQFERAMTLDPPMAEAMLGFMAVYYDSYKSNRLAFDSGGAKAVEPHWKLYYQRAVERNLQKAPAPYEVLAVLLYGIDAHIIDFGRALRYTLANSGVNADEFRAVHLKTDAAFFKADEAINKDVAEVRKLKGKIMSLESQLSLGARYVIKGRNEAWTEAVGKGPLRARATQPVLPRLDGSNTYFTLSESEACKKPLY